MNTTTYFLLAALLVGIASAPGAAACHKSGDLCVLYEENVEGLTPGSDADDLVYFGVDTVDHIVEDILEP